MIQLRHQQPSLWGGFWAGEVADLWEPWMRKADRLLDDEALLEAVYEAQGKRREHSRTLGRKQTPSEVVLRLLILKHARNWSFEALEREVRANLIYRDFTRLGTEKVPDAKVLAKIAKSLLNNNLYKTDNISYVLFSADLQTRSRHVSYFSRKDMVAGSGRDERIPGSLAGC
jgi:hypothetical protein